MALLTGTTHVRKDAPGAPQTLLPAQPGVRILLHPPKPLQKVRVMNTTAMNDGREVVAAVSSQHRPPLHSSLASLCLFCQPQHVSINGHQQRTSLGTNADFPMFFLSDGGPRHMALPGASSSLLLPLQASYCFAVCGETAVSNLTALVRA